MHEWWAKNRAWVVIWLAVAVVPAVVVFGVVEILEVGSADELAQADVVEMESERFGTCELAVVEMPELGETEVVVLGCTRGGR